MDHWRTDCGELLKIPARSASKGAQGCGPLLALRAG
jgi:hypothetical protein